MHDGYDIDLNPVITRMSTEGSGLLAATAWDCCNELEVLELLCSGPLRPPPPPLLAVPSGRLLEQTC